MLRAGNHRHGRLREKLLQIGCVRSTHDAIVLALEDVNGRRPEGWPPYHGRARRPATATEHTLNVGTHISFQQVVQTTLKIRRFVEKIGIRLAFGYAEHPHALRHHEAVPQRLQPARRHTLPTSFLLLHHARRSRDQHESGNLLGPARGEAKCRAAAHRPPDEDTALNILNHLLRLAIQLLHVAKETRKGRAYIGQDARYPSTCLFNGQDARCPSRRAHEFTKVPGVRARRPAIQHEDGRPRGCSRTGTTGILPVENTGAAGILPVAQSLQFRGDGADFATATSLVITVSHYYPPPSPCGLRHNWRPRPL